jgi:hypothetical protein
MSATNITKSERYFISGSFGLFFEISIKTKEKISPENAQRANDVGRFVRRIIFLIKTASLPEKI